MKMWFVAFHRYQLAFVDYQLVINLNGSIEQAKMGCTRYGGWGFGYSCDVHVKIKQIGSITAE